MSLGDAVDRFGADAFRYFLLREVPFDGDGGFSWARFEDRYNADLANGLGNLASRAISMVERYCEGVVPASGRSDLDAADDRDIADYHAAMDGSRGFLLHQGLSAVWRMVGRANEFVQASQPWVLARDPSKRAELDGALASLLRTLARQSVLLAPFIPSKAQELWERLGGTGPVASQRFAGLAAIDPAGWSVRPAPPLFPRDEAKRASAS